MQFGVIGINYKNASLSIREKAVFTDTKKMEMYVLLEQAGIEESVILSTCNRSELYFLYQEEIQLENIKSMFLAFFEQIDLAPYIFVKTQREALTYLFEVSNGLRSLVLGEDQIAGQVVKSEEFARDNGQCHKIMSFIFRSVITCTKKAKTMYRISEHPLSLSYVAVKQLKTVCELKGKRALILGTGKMSSLALQYLIESGVQEVYLANRTANKAIDMMQEFTQEQCNLICIDFKERYDYIKQCDILISATASPHAIIQASQLPKIEHDVYMIDMASPRDIELEVHTRPHIHVYDMDFMQQTIATNHEIRKEKVNDIQNLINEEVEHVVQWMNTVKLDHTIKTLQERIQEVSDEAYALLNRKLTLSEHDKFVLQKTLKTSMQRLMNDAIVTLKKEEDTQKQEQYHTAVKELFHIEN